MHVGAPRRMECARGLRHRVREFGRGRGPVPARARGRVGGLVRAGVRGDPSRVSDARSGVEPRHEHERDPVRPALARPRGGRRPGHLHRRRHDRGGLRGLEPRAPAREPGRGRGGGGRCARDRVDADRGDSQVERCGGRPRGPGATCAALAATRGRIRCHRGDARRGDRGSLEHGGRDDHHAEHALPGPEGGAAAPGCADGPSAPGERAVRGVFRERLLRRAPGNAAVGGAPGGRGRDGARGGRGQPRRAEPRGVGADLCPVG